MEFRTGSIQDIDAVLALFDANVAWLVEQGRADQWGSDPWSQSPRHLGFVRELMTDDTVTIAEIDGEIVGASVVSDHPMPYVPAVEEEERYLKLLIASPAHRGKKIGHQLIDLARERTVSEGVGLLRVDCYAGDDRRLVQYYVDEDFTPTEEIEVRPGTSVQVFEWRPSSDQGAWETLERHAMRRHWSESGFGDGEGVIRTLRQTTHWLSRDSVKTQRAMACGH